MGWWKRYWRGGPYPGNGPFSHLPPWERPGWMYGRGWCWQYPGLWYTGTPAPSTYTPPPWTDKSSELKYLEDLKKQIEGRIEELKKSEK